MTAIRKATSWTAALGTAALVISASPQPAQARPWPGDPQQNAVDVSTPSASDHCPLNRLGTQLVRCDNLTGAGVTAPGWVPALRTAPGQDRASE